MNRVAVTGIGAISPLGHDWPTVHARLRERRNAVQEMLAWAVYDGLNTRLGVPAAEFALPAEFNRKATRSMGRVALMATRASQLALQESGLAGSDFVRRGRMGIAYGSSAGTPDAIADFARMREHNSIDGINANTYIKMMSHTAAVNIGVFFGITGRIVTTSSACTSGSQALGYAYEAIRFGRQLAMLAGGAEELDARSGRVRHTVRDQRRTTARP
jgi:3-oxoacyl-[acyl-carrier-protein] synthase II